jgi:hypothetical protein
MSTRRSLGRVFAALGSVSLFGFAACQQLLGLDQPTVSVSAISRICECIPLTLQGLDFAGSDTSACELALEEKSDEILLAVAGNDCTDCANVVDCYAQLTEAGGDSDACSNSSGCGSWACCQGVFRVALTFDGGVKPALLSTPADPSCCESCSGCGDAFASLNSDDGVVACAEARAPLLDLVNCVSKYAGPGSACECGPPNGVTPDCIQCLVAAAVAVPDCGPEYDACEADRARPIPEQE